MVRIIGDVHNLIDEHRKDGFSFNPDATKRTYLDLIKGCRYSIQVGDMGYGKYFHKKMSQVDEFRHRVVLGNHDDYDRIIPHSLGDYGTYNIDSHSFSFVRGAFSIDRFCRTVGYDYWVNEELTNEQGNKAIEYFNEKKYVHIMITHECPSFLLDEKHLITKYSNCSEIKPSYTSRLLNEIYTNLVVDNWIFGHHHLNFDKVINNTRFICLNELAYVDVENGKVGCIK